MRGVRTGREPVMLKFRRYAAVAVLVGVVLCNSVGSG
jgi:hypothetical protein